MVPCRLPHAYRTIQPAIVDSMLHTSTTGNSGSLRSYACAAQKHTMCILHVAPGLKHIQPPFSAATGRAACMSQASVCCMLHTTENPGSLSSCAWAAPRHALCSLHANPVAASALNASICASQQPPGQASGAHLFRAGDLASPNGPHRLIGDDHAGPGRDLASHRLELL